MNIFDELDWTEQRERQANSDGWRLDVSGWTAEICAFGSRFTNNEQAKGHVRYKAGVGDPLAVYALAVIGGKIVIAQTTRMPYAAIRAWRGWVRGCPALVLHAHEHPAHPGDTDYHLHVSAGVVETTLGCCWDPAGEREDSTLPTHVITVGRTSLGRLAGGQLVIERDGRWWTVVPSANGGLLIANVDVDEHPQISLWSVDNDQYEDLPLDAEELQMFLRQPELQGCRAQLYVGRSAEIAINGTFAELSQRVI